MLNVLKDTKGSLNVGTPVNAAIKSECKEEVVKSTDTYCLLADQQSFDKENSALKIDDKVVLVKGKCQGFSTCSKFRAADDDKQSETSKEDGQTTEDKTSRHVNLRNVSTFIHICINQWGQKEE